MAFERGMDLNEDVMVIAIPWDGNEPPRGLPPLKITICMTMAFTTMYSRSGKRIRRQNEFRNTGSLVGEERISINQTPAVPNLQSESWGMYGRVAPK